MKIHATIPLRLRGGITTPFVLSILLLLLVPAIAGATPIISVTPAAAIPGTSGFFDVELTNPGPITVGAFGFGVSIPVSSFFTLTSVTSTEPVRPDYIFSVANGGGFFSPGAPTFPGPAAIASDFTMLPFPTGVAVGPGVMFSLGRVSFDVAPTAPVGSSVPISITPPGITGLADPVGASIAFTTSGGSVNSSAPVPEPSTLLLLCVGVLGVLGVGWRRKRKA